MMPRIFPRALTALALVTALTRVASAQAATGIGTATPAQASSPAMRWDAHPTGKYLLELTLPDRKMQASLTIADSAGTPVAVLWPVGDNEGKAMSVTVNDTDLTLHADTPRGPFAATLQRDGDHITGRWSIGMQQSGTLEGRPETSAATP